MQCPPCDIQATELQAAHPGRFVMAHYEVLATRCRPQCSLSPDLPLPRPAVEVGKLLGDLGIELELAGGEGGGGWSREANSVVSHFDLDAASF
jgi:hypothetical protein